jgi:hypothetical protein
MRRAAFLLILGAFVMSLCPLLAAAGAENSYPVGSFNQQVHTPYTVEQGLPSNDVWAIEYAHGRDVIAATAEGLVRFADGTWQPIGDPDLTGVRILSTGRTVLDCALCRNPFWGTTVYAATEHKIVVVYADIQIQRTVARTNQTITALAVDGEAVWFGTKQGLFKIKKKKPKPVKALNGLLRTDQTVRAIDSYEGEVAVATQDGLFVWEDGQDWRPVYPQEDHRRWAPVDIRAITYDSQGQLWFACPQGVGCWLRDGQWRLYTGAEGLPYNDFTCVATGVDGRTVWFGTRIGAVGRVGDTWEYREGRRWVVDNDVRDIAVTPEGDVWLATAGGVSHIKQRPMTLAQKAAFYEDEIDRHHRRTLYEYVVNAGLDVPGDKSTAKPYVTDNDGQYTGLYAGAECLAYAATGDKRFKERATKVFEALAFLSEVTQGGSNPAPPGFVSRAIMPIDGPNPNEHDNPERDRRRQQGDAMWKVIDPRWPVSEDGKWYWKTDTSSDELDGHYFAYGLYYDHVAETEDEKARCREVVRRVTDHLIKHDFRLVDHDGKPTRWARFSPKDLNDDRRWWTERGLNSLSVLTYLSVAHHVTGDPKYREAYMSLVEDHKYALNGMVMPKLQAGPGSFVQFDDKMAFMNYYHLIRYETDPELLNMYYTSIFYYWHIEKYELNPFFNFVYAACCLGKTRTDQWGELDVSPTGPWLEQSVDTLRRYPMDLVNWRTTNSHRLDILPLPDHVREPGQHVGKGYRVNGYVLPVDERQSLSWSEDTWALDTGGDGRRLRDGCPYLLAYYMGLHHGFIQE